MDAQAIAKASTVYAVECVRAFHATGAICPAPWACPLYHERSVVWRETVPNLVVTAGLNKLLDATLKTGLASPAWYVFLKGVGSILASDTMGSHAGWTEATGYAEATRPAFVPGTVAAGSVDNAASKAVFSINAGATLAGIGLADADTKGGASGTLYGAADFSATRSVLSGDELDVQVTATITG